MKYDAEVMMKACQRDAPREACGLVFPDGMTMEITNVRSGPGSYVMHEGEFYTAAKTFGMFSAIWHTHPNGDVNPSPFDREFHLRHYDDICMIIATPTETAVYACDD